VKARYTDTEQLRPAAGVDGGTVHHCAMRPGAPADPHQHGAGSPRARAHGASEAPSGEKTIASGLSALSRLARAVPGAASPAPRR